MIFFLKTQETTKIPDQVRDGRSKRLLWLFVLFAIFISIPCSGRTAFEIPAQSDGYVTDRAALLSTEARRRLEDGLHEFELQTSNQIVVATFPSMEGGSLEDLSIRIAQQWKLGRKDRDNGVLFLIFRDDHQMRIEVGYGLEGALTDALSAQIIRNEVTPYFRAGEYQNGILSGVKAILAATKGEYQPQTQPPDKGISLLKTLFGIAFFIFALDLIRYAFYWSGHHGDKNAYGFWEWFFIFALFWIILRIILTSRSGSGWSSGGRGSYSGGGFSGGGGSFGGGGASGRW